jgi:hypothetical protein
MRGLAEFVMKGRKQAIMAVLLLGLIPIVNFLSPVVVGLVVLRKGLSEATQVLVWAILPIGGWAIAGDPVPMIMLLGITGLAGLLRASESWEFTAFAAGSVGFDLSSDAALLRCKRYTRRATGFAEKCYDQLYGRGLYVSRDSPADAFSLDAGCSVQSWWISKRISWTPGRTESCAASSRLNDAGKFWNTHPAELDAVFGFTADVLRACPVTCGGGGEEVIEPLVSGAVCDNRVANNSEYDRAACTTR